MNNIVIEQIDKSSPYLKKVNALADKNTQTLGFLPYMAFEEYASRKSILIALNDKGILLGYLLYRHVKQQNHVRIVHLCVDSSYRGYGVARQLFEELRRRTQVLTGIGLWCRRDYEEANKVWRNLGFAPISEKLGRGQEPSTLTFWWFNHGRTLFDLISSEKLKIAIDANIFFDFQDSTKGAKESLALLNNDLTNEVVLIVTKELANEINRNTNTELRRKYLNEFQTYPKTQDRDGHFSSIYSNLRPLFPSDLSDNQESDLRQIAWSIADPDVNFFATRDEGLLKIGADIFDQFNLSIIHPVDLILHLDELFRIEGNRKMRLAGTNIKQRRVQKGEHEQLAYLFQNTNKEKKGKFLNLLRQNLLERETCSCYVIEDTPETILALFVYERTNGVELTIPVFRVYEEAKDLARYLILSFLNVSSNEGRTLTKISDPNLEDWVIDLLQEDAFTQIGGARVKLNLPIAKSSKQVAAYMDEVIQNKPELRTYYKIYPSILRDENAPTNTEAMSEIERLFWPVKITDADIPTITVPINSTWAALWFDQDLAVQGLFGAEKDRAFNREGVYYSAAIRRNVTLPGRILWYVTKDSRIVGTESIRACSRLQDIVIGRPKDLFRKFRHLGIYEWKDVFRTAKNDLEQEIMAIRFSDTQLFKRPVSYTEWQQFTLKETGNNPPKFSPAPMPISVFEQVYRLGMELD